MDNFFFSGSHSAKLDEKNRLVLPQDFRFGLVENGRLEFSVGFGLGGCLAVYRQSDIMKIAQQFRQSQHIARFQKFFTLFFSTLHQTTCDKIGRFIIPQRLKNVIGIKKEIVIAGVLDKIELWPAEVYEKNLHDLINNENDEWNLEKITEEAFSLLNTQKMTEKENEKGLEKLSEETMSVLNGKKNVPLS